jgi:hypothetical protein
VQDLADALLVVVAVCPIADEPGDEAEHEHQAEEHQGSKRDVTCLWRRAVGRRDQRNRGQDDENPHRAGEGVLEGERIVSEVAQVVVEQLCDDSDEVEGGRSEQGERDRVAQLLRGLREHVDSQADGGRADR